MGADTVYQIVTDRIVEKLEAGVVPWRQPWKGGNRPSNLVSGKPYRGINVILLGLTAMERGYGSPWWLTMNQVKSLGGTLKVVPPEDRAEGDKSKTGQHPTLIVFWQMVKDRSSEDPEATRPLLRYYTVFNLDQTEGVKVPRGRDTIEAPLADLTPVESAEKIIGGYPNPPRIVEGEPRAWYRVDTDLINLPKRETFESIDEFYTTAFHELTHSTGHPKRLNRDDSSGNVFGSHDYGREELTAELGAAFLSAEAGIESTQDNSAAYIGGWLRKIKEDVRAVVVAAGAAQKAADFITDRQPERSES